jgi:hypothetical protein
MKARADRLPERGPVLHAKFDQLHPKCPVLHAKYDQLHPKCPVLHAKWDRLRPVRFRDDPHDEFPPYERGCRLPAPLSNDWTGAAPSSRGTCQAWGNHQAFPAAEQNCKSFPLLDRTTSASPWRLMSIFSNQKPPCHHKQRQSMQFDTVS